MKRYFIISILMISAVGSLISCGGKYKRSAGRSYAPDMVYSRAVDFYHDDEKITEAGGHFNRLPVNGTVAREQPLPNHVTENDTAITYGMSNPYALTVKDLERGQHLYQIQCAICHGAKLDGNGPLYTSEKFTAAPANLLGANYINFTQGKIYHAIVFGKNAMGSYASQLDDRERWSVVAYIKKIQSENGGSSFTMVTNEAPEAEAKVENKDTAKNEGH